MLKNEIMKMAKSTQAVLRKRSPEILTGIGIAGMISTTILAVRATPKALVIIEEEKQEKEVERLTTLETVKVAWPCYIPAIATGALSITCLVGASSVNVRRNAALATAYTLSESALKEYKDKVIETIGEKKEKAVQEFIAEDRLKNNPVNNQEIIFTGKGHSLCYDPFSGRYFESDIDEIKKALNEFNAYLMNNGCASLNDWYYMIGLEPTEIGALIGWRIEFGNANTIELNFIYKSASDGRPCVCIDFVDRPVHDYDRYL